mmetsp:Transcript_7482/g.12956  ORF Transcript_7482/g.12956 Transcript_7482/m.12956 type:complete len:98 (+) Transcript_7482:215-508(+)
MTNSQIAEKSYNALHAQITLGGSGASQNLHLDLHRSIFRNIIATSKCGPASKSASKKPSRREAPYLQVHWRPKPSRLLQEYKAFLASEAGTPAIDRG